MKPAAHKNPNTSRRLARLTAHLSSAAAWWEGKSVIITGATSGIGKAAAIEAAARGANVVVAGRREEEGAAVVASIKASGGAAVFCKTDVSSEADCEAMVACAVSNFGRLDAAVNNAGTNIKTNVQEATEEDFDQIFGVNVKGVFFCMKHEIRAMLKTGGGSIVNVSSVSGIRASSSSALYSASKHALTGLVKTTAAQFAAKNIRVNNVCPGYVRTELSERFFDNFTPLQQFYYDNVQPAGYIMGVEEIVNPALWLLSNEASYIHGQDLAVDGGMTSVGSVSPTLMPAIRDEAGKPLAHHGQ